MNENSNSIYSTLYKLFVFIKSLQSSWGNISKNNCLVKKKLSKIIFKIWYCPVFIWTNYKIFCYKLPEAIEPNTFNYSSFPTNLLTMNSKTYTYWNITLKVYDILPSHSLIFRKSLLFILHLYIIILLIPLLYSYICYCLFMCMYVCV